MATGPLGRQPDKLDYLSPTQFRFGINQLPKVEFFTVAANIPGINMGEAIFPTPFKDIPIMGDKLYHPEPTKFHLKRMALHAAYLAFQHPLNMQAIEICSDVTF